MGQSNVHKRNSAYLKKTGKITAEWWKTRHVEVSLAHEDVDRYFKEIGRHELLTREEERELYQRFERASLNLLVSLLAFPSVRNRFRTWIADIRNGRLPVTDVFVSYPERGKSRHRPKKTPRLMESVMMRPAQFRQIQFVLAEKRITTIDLEQVDQTLPVSVRRLVAYVQQLRFQTDRIDELIALVDSDCAAVYPRKKTGMILSQRERFRARAYRALAEMAEIRKTMIEKNLRLVIDVAKPYFRMTTLSFLDIVSHGNFGLIRAVERYSHRRQARFSTYASWWIRQSMFRGMAEEGHSIRRPQHIQSQIGIIRRNSGNLSPDDMSSEQVAEILEVSKDSAQNVIQAMQAKTVSFETMKFGTDDDQHMTAESFSDDQAANALDLVVADGLQRNIESILTELTEREAEIIRLRFGLIDGNPKNLEEVGKIFNLTRERIRQIEAKALKRLQLPSRARRLRPYYEA